jgi:uncharacterized protein YbjT (DUF2867 family)
MKILVVGGSGLIGRLLARQLAASGCNVVCASRSTAVDTLTGRGLEQTLSGVDVVVDVTNPSSCSQEAALEFFEGSTRNLLAAAAVAGARHHIILSMVGAERSPDSSYLRAKALQERLVVSGPVPFTIVRATLFFESLSAVARVATENGMVYVSPSLCRPIAAADVAGTLASVCLDTPIGAIVELAGPETFSLAKLIHRYLNEIEDPRKVVPDASARLFGAAMNSGWLIPGASPQLGSIRFDDWLMSTRERYEPKRTCSGQLKVR